MSLAVSDIRNEIHVLSLRTAEKPVDRIDKDLDDVDVLPLVEPADVIRLRNLTLMENQVYRPCVILDIEPVPHVLALSVDRKRLAVTDIVDKQGNELLRKLVRAVIVGTVGHHYRHPVRIMESPHEMVGRSLGCRIGAVRIVFRILGEEIPSVSQMMGSG